MPRDIGTGLYHYPEGTPGTPAQTIFSTRYNTFINDLTNTLNQALPVNMGGTGGDSIDSALVSMSGEKATQLVTDYDNHFWMPGSFRSNAAAPGAPNPTSKFAGICYIGEALANPPTNQNVVVEARDLDSAVKPGLLYTRQKTAGVWSAWNYAGTGDDQTAARSAIYAAPFDAMAYNGMQVNGSMEVSQELGTAGVLSNGYFADGWSIGTIGSSVCTASSFAVGYPGFEKAALVQVSTAQPSMGAGDYVTIHTFIEGYRVSRLSWGLPQAMSITIGFWTGHTRTGTYSVTARNAGGRTYVATYTQNVSATLEYKTITIPGDTGGTWNKANGRGLLLGFALASGATFTVPAANVWTAGDFIAAPGQVNSVAATSDVFRLTGVVILPGAQVPAAAQSPLIMRPYDQELVTCQRYWEQAPASSRITTTAGGQVIDTPITWRVVKRAAPTVIVVPGARVNVTAVVASDPTIYGARFEITAAIASDTYALNEIINADARL